ncbi:MAG: peptidase S8 [Deltaproteobacteria bacterium]|nr:peptidase S8 [Deltaproteobacteria bacterium]
MPRQLPFLVVVLCLLFSPLRALGEDAVTDGPFRLSSNVSVSRGRVSINALHVPLAPLLQEVAQKAKFAVTISPVFSTTRVTVILSNTDVEAAVQEILRRAGITNAAWAYRKKPQASGKQDEWELAHLTIVAQGHGSSLTALKQSPTDRAKQEQQKNLEPGKKLLREQFHDPKSQQRIDVAAHEVMVRFDPKMSPDEIQRKIDRLHAEVISSIPQFGFYHLSISESDTVSSFIDKHRKDPRLQVLEPNPIISADPVSTPLNDPLFRSQWSLERIGASQAWEQLPNGAGTVVAVVDSGVDGRHPELQRHILPGRNIIEQNDDTQDQHGHGTAIAGIIAASTNNAVGMSGICPTCQILPVRVLNDSGEGTYSHVIAGILWAADNRAQIVNLSLGSYGFSRFLADAIEYAQHKGAVIVAAGGNEATQAPLYPGALPNVISVAATDIDDNLWVGSNYGEAIDIVAPGVRILSLDTHNNYLFATGSSFSAAQVSGVAALVRTKHPSLKNTQVAQILFQTADDLGGKGKDQFYGFGRINAARALRAELR